MTVKSFMDAYEGGWHEFSSIANYDTRDQCVDLFLFYNKLVIGAPVVFGNALDYWEKYPTDFYEKIPNAKDNWPKFGDVVIWGKKYGPYGHIAICTEISDVNGFTSFDQNDPLKSRSHYQPHNYTGVLGWLRPKNLPSEQSQIVVAPINDQTKIDMGSLGIMEVQAIRSTIIDLKKVVDDFPTQVIGFETKISDYKRNQSELAELLGCENNSAAIKSEVVMLIKREDEHNGITTPLWIIALNNFFKKLGGKGGDTDGKESN